MSNKTTYIGMTAIAVGVTWDFVQFIRIKKRYTQILEEKIALQNLVVTQRELVMYLAEMLERNEVEITEFDRIALKNINR
jgi:hypothetical protein